MFVIGILSTPLPFILMAFAYLTGLGMGFFQKHENLATEDQFASNIRNYEVLTPAVEQIAEQVHFTDFLNSGFSDQNQTASFEDFLVSYDHFNTYSPPVEELLQYHYIHTSNLFSRPPPTIS